MADNDELIFKVGMDTDDLLKGIEKIKDKAQKGLEFTAGEKSLRKINKQLTDALEVFTKTADEAKKLGESTLPSDKYVEAKKELEDLKTALEGARKEKDKFDEQTDKKLKPQTRARRESSNYYVNLKKDIAKMSREIPLRESNIQRMEKAGTDVAIGTETQQYRDQVELLEKKRQLLDETLTPIKEQLAIQQQQEEYAKLQEEETRQKAEEEKTAAENIADAFTKLKEQLDIINEREYVVDFFKNFVNDAKLCNEHIVEVGRKMQEFLAIVNEGKETGAPFNPEDYEALANKLSEFKQEITLVEGETTRLADSLATSEYFNEDGFGEGARGVETLTHNLKLANQLYEQLNSILGENSAQLDENAESVKSVEEQIAQYELQLQQLIALRDAFQIDSPGVDSTATSKTFYNINEAISELEGKLSLLRKESEPIDIDIDADDVDRSIYKIAELSLELDRLRASRKDLKAKEKEQGLGEDDMATLNQVETSIILTKKAINDYAKELRKAADGGEQMAESNGKVSDSSRRLNGIMKKLSISSFGLKDAFKHIGHYMKSAEKAHNQFSRSLKHGMTNLTKYVFGFRSLFFLIRRLRNVVKEGVQNLVQYDSANNETNKAMTELQTSLLFLKNAWGAAFAPILNVVLPILSSLLDMIAAVGNAIARLIATLTGQETVIQAVRVQTEDYADSLKSAGGGASKTSKAAEKLHDRLAAFDDLNVLGKDDETDPNKSGGGGGGGNALTPSINDMFERVTAQSTLADMLKESWVTGDFSSVGKLIGEKIQESLYSIPWDDIKETANKIGFGAGTFLTGLFGDPETFRSIGSTFAEALNTVSTAIHGFFEGYKGGLGSGAAEAVKEFLVDTDWHMIGENVGDVLSTIAQELADFFNGLDIEATSEAWKEFADGVKDTELLTAVNNLNEAFGGLVYRLGMDWVGDFLYQHDILVAAFVPWAYWLVHISDLWNKLVDGFVHGCEVVDAVLMESFKGIGESFYKFGEDVGEGLWLIHENIDNILAFCENAVHVVAIAVFMPLFTYVQALMSNVGVMKADIQSNIAGLQADIQARVSAIKFVINSNIAVIKQTCGGLFGFVLNNFDLVVSGFESMGDGISSAWDWIQGIFIDGANSVLGTIDTWADAMIDVINAVLDAFASFSIPIDSDLVSAAGAFGITGLVASTLDFNIGSDRLSHITVPRLAQGAVIPANNEFMAILGDQKHGTNIEAPLDTIKQAVAEVLAGSGNAEMIRLLQQLIMVVESKNLTIGDKEIGQANARYQTRQNIIRGVRGV